MTRVKRTHVYTGKYAMVGADGASACRMSVRAHVQLPYGELDRWSMPIGPENMIVRNRRVQTRLEAQAQAKQGALKAAGITKRKPGSVSKKAAWTAMLMTMAFFSILLLGQYGAVAQKESVLHTLKAQVQTQSDLNTTLQNELNEAADEVKIRYQAVQELGMVAPKGVTAITLVVPGESITQEVSIEDQIPKGSDFLASLFAFLD